MRMMKAILVALALSLCASGAMAQERSTDAAIGAVSGAIVLGPIGAVAGALIGYAAGPAISRSWGVRGRQSSAGQPRRVATGETPSANDARNQANAQMVVPARPAAPRRAPAAPPVQALE